MDMTISIPDPDAPDVQSALCYRHGYMDFLMDEEPGSPTFGQMVVPNPVSKGVFAKQVVIRWMKDEYRQYKFETQVGALNVSADADADSLSLT